MSGAAPASTRPWVGARRSRPPRRAPASRAVPTGRTPTHSRSIALPAPRRSSRAARASASARRSGSARPARAPSRRCRCRARSRPTRGPPPPPIPTTTRRGRSRASIGLRRHAVRAARADESGGELVEIGDADTRGARVEQPAARPWPIDRDGTRTTGTRRSCRSRRRRCCSSPRTSARRAGVSGRAPRAQRSRSAVAMKTAGSSIAATRLERRRRRGRTATRRPVRRASWCATSSS